jgi:hypothetical protein
VINCVRVSVMVYLPELFLASSITEPLDFFSAFPARFGWRYLAPAVWILTFHVDPPFRSYLVTATMLFIPGNWRTQQLVSFANLPPNIQGAIR